MKKKKIIGVILIIIAIVFIGVAMILLAREKKDKDDILYVEPDPVVIKSDLLEEKQNFNNIDFTDFTVRIYEDRQEVSIKLQNNTDKKLEKKECTLILFDSNGNELQRLFALLPELQPSDTRYLGLETSTDLSKIHDYKIIDRE